MKKVYQSPAIMLEEADCQTMIAASDGLLENGFNTNTAESLDNSITNGNLSRQGKSLWDNEDDF